MMKLDCMHCDGSLHLNHPVFWRYQGPVKCFHCGNVMNVTIFDGRVQLSSVPKHNFTKGKTRRRLWN